MLNDKIDKKKYLIKKNKMNSSQLNKLVEKIIHIIRFNKNFIKKIIFYLIIQ